MAVQDKDKLVSLEDLKTAYDDLDGDVGDLKNTLTIVSEYDGLLTSNNLFDKNNIHDGYIVNGVVTQTTNHSYSDFISVDTQGTYCLRGIGLANGNKVQIGLYDINKHWLRDIISTELELITSGTNYPFRINFANINTPFAFIRLNIITSNADEYMFVKGNSYPSEYLPYNQKLKSEELESYFDGKLEPISQSLQDFEYALLKYVELPISILNGFFTNINGSSSTPTANNGYYCSKIRVNPGEKYKVTGTVRRYAYGTTSLVVFIDEQDTEVIGNILPEATTTTTYTDYEFTIPDGCGYIGITSIVTIDDVTYPKPVLKKQVIAGNGNIIVSIDDSNIIVETKNGNTYRWKKLPANNLYQLYSWTINGITITHNTDMVGPFIGLNAVNNANGNRSTSSSYIGTPFTGGCHGFNGDQTGTPTASLIERKIILNGVTQETNGLYECNSVTIQFKNGIQGNNTCLEAGGGRVIMNETQTFTIDDDVIKVSVLLDPLEELVLEKYYGMQLAGYSTYYMLSDKYYEIGNQGSKNITPEIIVGYDSNSQMSMRMEKIGLGDYHLNTTDSKATSSSDKAYFVPVNSNSAHWVAGEKQYWIGEYALGRVLDFAQ